MLKFKEVAGAVYRKEHGVLSGLTPSEVNTCDEDGRSPLMHAVLDTESQRSIVQLLLERGAEVNTADTLHRSTALHFAASLGKNDMAFVLLEAGAEIDAVNDLGNTPLWEATMRHSQTAAVIEELLCRGADSSRKNNQGVSAIDLVREGKHAGLLALFERRPQSGKPDGTNRTESPVG